MLRLILMRHAKSSWSDNSIRDFDRPLNERGVRNAGEMGIFLSKQGVFVNRLLCSPAKRTLETLEHIKNKLNIEDTRLCESLYEASMGEVISEIQKHGNCKVLMVVGHNPSISNTGSFLLKETIDHFPTAGVLCLDFEITSWQDIQPMSGKLVFKKFPKEI